jgi:hypothetical protein
MLPLAFEEGIVFHHIEGTTLRPSSFNTKLVVLLDSCFFGEFVQLYADLCRFILCIGFGPNIFLNENR